MKLQTAGIHHITAFARDPQRNVDFYTGVLGLRLVKRTINFDAPEVYHLYFGDASGSPGTIITFFPHPGSRKGRVGGGQVGTTTYTVPPGSLAYWEGRLKSFGVSVMKAERFSEAYLQFADNEGLRLELVEREAEAAGGSVWTGGDVPQDKAIRGFGGAVLLSVNAAKTARVLEEVLGLQKIGEDVHYARYRAAGGIGNLIDLSLSDQEWGAGGAGTVHHIAWRARDFAEHETWRGAVEQAGYQPTPIIDRQYFNAVYFREGGGILFEIATDPPGFAVDEEPAKLGDKLMLPAWYEPHREQIEANLLPIRIGKPEEGERE